MATLRRKNSRTRRIATFTLVLILLALVMQAIESRHPTEERAARGFFAALATPVLMIGGALRHGTENVWLTFRGTEQLREENERLRQELLEAQLEGHRTLSAEALATLSHEVSTNIPKGTWDLQPVPVLSGPVTGGRQVLWIAAGSRDGIRSGMVVLGPRGIAGVVEEVHESMSLVQLVTDRRSVWGAEIEGRSELGMLRGTGDSRRAEFHFNRTAVFADALDTVVSSGMAGSLAPGGVLFGVVEELVYNRQGEPVAIVRLPEEPARLRTVFVLPLERLPETGPQ